MNNDRFSELCKLSVKELAAKVEWYEENYLEEPVAWIRNGYVTTDYPRIELLHEYEPLFRRMK